MKILNLVLLLSLLPLFVFSASLPVKDGSKIIPITAHTNNPQDQEIMAILSSLSESQFNRLKTLINNNDSFFSTINRQKINTDTLVSSLTKDGSGINKEILELIISAIINSQPGIVIPNPLTSKVPTTTIGESNVEQDILLLLQGVLKMLEGLIMQEQAGTKECGYGAILTTPSNTPSNPRDCAGLFNNNVRGKEIFDLSGLLRLLRILFGQTKNN